MSKPSTNFNSNDRENNGNPTDGISKVQAGGFLNSGENQMKLVPGGDRTYRTTKIFQSSNWYER